MASSKRRNRKKNHGRLGATGSRDPRILAAPKMRLKPLFKVFRQVTDAADRAVLSRPLDFDDMLARFDAEILVRGINSVKAARLLMEHGHWEHAVGTARQLFELLINMEHLAGMEDREKGVLLYLRFGVLQLTLEQRRNLLYARETGRTIDTDRLAALSQVLDSHFADFKGKPKHDGTETWVPSWSRKNTKTLVELSTNAMRKHQYEHLYTSWSEQAHATPSSLIDNIVRQNDEGWVDQVIKSDNEEITGASAMTLLLFLELWESLPYVEQPARDQSLEWMRQVMHLISAPDFESLPGYRRDS